jgi:L-cysteine S-thiosulfotransferase
VNPLRRRLAAVLTMTAAGVLALAGTADAAAAIVGDGMPEPLTATPGDATRGRAIVAQRQLGLCLLCHSGPIAEERFQGNLAPPLDGAGSRWTTAQLRLRVADARHLNPTSLMPTLHAPQRTPPAEQRVGRAWAGKPVLDAQQVEDVVAWLQTLR